MKGRTKKAKVETPPPPPSTPFEVLAKEYGFDSVTDPKLYDEFLQHIKDELRAAVRVAILDADNKNRRTLTFESIEIVRRTVHIFPTVKK